MPLTHQEAKAAVKAQKAYAKATRPWFKKKRFIFLGVIVVIGIISAINAGGSDEAAPAPDTEGTVTEAPAVAAAEVPAVAAAATIGTPVRDGKFEFTVNGVECGVPQIGTADFGVTAQGQFCLVDVTVKNIGDEPQTFMGDYQALYNAAEQKYSADTEAAIYLDEANSMFEEINPGNQLAGKVVFDIPADAAPATIELHDSAFSGGVKVALS